MRQATPEQIAALGRALLRAGVSPNMDQAAIDAVRLSTELIEQHEKNGANSYAAPLFGSSIVRDNL